MFVFAMFSQSVTSKEAKCPDISGTYHFLGKAVDLTVIDQLSDMRFDEKAMAMTVRTVIDPHTVVVKHDLLNGMLTVDVIGKGNDPRFESMSAKLPLKAVFSCEGESWVRRKTIIGGAGGGRPTETNIKITLSLVSNGVLAEGIMVSEAGTLSRKSITKVWCALFSSLTK